jgi:hypothetical protein
VQAEGLPVAVSSMVLRGRRRRTLISFVVILGASYGDDLGYRFEVVARAACGLALIVGGALLAVSLSRRRESIADLDGSRGSP